MQNTFQPEQYKINGDTNTKDLTDMVTLFLRNHWDDVVVMFVVLTIIFIFVVFTGNRIKPDEETEKRVMQILFRSEKKKEKSDEYLETTEEETMNTVTEQEKKIGIDYEHPDKEFFDNN